MKDLISQLREAGCMQLTFTGGEPLLRKDFFEIASFARSKGFILRLFSNATLIDDLIAKKLKSLKFKEVRISLFSADEKLHDSITRHEGSFRKTIAAIGLLEKNDIPFRVSAVAMEQNIRKIPELIKTAKENKWRFSHDPTIYPSYGGSKSPVSNRIMGEGLKFFRDRCLGAGYKTASSKWNELSAFYLANLHCYISADGRVFPHATIRMESGDLKRQSFKDIWENSPNLKYLRNLKIDDFACSQCDHFLNCQWSLGLALSEHGKITAKPREYCRIMKTEEVRVV